MSDGIRVVNESRTPRRRLGTFVLALVLGLQVVFVGAGLVKAKDQPSLHNPRFETIHVPDDQLPLTPETGQSYAQQYATQWEPGARLVAATLRLGWPDTIGSAAATVLPRDGALTYIFVSGRKSLTLYLDRGSGNFSGAVENRQGGSVWSTLDLSSYQKSSTIAGLTADLLAGFAYREPCPDRRPSSYVTADRITIADGSIHPAWTVTYEDERHRDMVDVVVRMDAITGDVVNNHVTPRDCNQN